MSRYLKVCLLVAFTALAGCHKGDVVKTTTDKGVDMTINSGSTVAINYTLKVDDKVADSSEGKEPLVYVAGSGQIIPGLDGELMGLKKGDKKQVTVAPENGYGVKDERAIQKVPRSTLQDLKDMKVGGVVSGKSGDQEFQAVISAITDKEVTLDFNHPLAGKTLYFDVEIMDVK